MTNDKKTTLQKYEDAAITLAYHVSNDVQFNGKLTHVSLDALEHYRATQAAWYAELDARIAARAEMEARIAAGKEAA